MTRLLLAAVVLLSACLTNTVEVDDDDDATVDDDDDDAGEPDLCADYEGCDVNASCEDTKDGPLCTCEPGWEGDGATCTDIDECLEDNGGCDDDAVCTNIDGARECDCKDGFIGDGLVCEEELPTWEFVASYELVWAEDWSPQTVVAWGSSIVWGSEKADGLDARVYEFDATSRVFSELAGGAMDLCACGYTQASAVLDDHLYLFGNAGQVLDLAAATPAWQVAAYPDARRRGEAGLAAHGGSLFQFGGRGPLDTNQEYSGGSAGTWTDRAPVPYPVDYAKPVSVDAHIYLLGGQSENGGKSHAARYAPETDTWTILATPPVDGGRTQSAGRLGDQLWLLQTGKLFFYDPASDAWADATIALPVGLTAGRTVTLDGVIHAIGGRDTATEVHRLIFP
jgi:hypothetical protein